MPIYEFYCSRCHRIYSFLSRSIDTSKSPDCPRCGQAHIPRRASSFAISKGRKEEAQKPDTDLPDFDEAKLMQAMEALGPEAENLDEENPREAARVMRKLFEATGLPLGGGMQEALKRMEAGEDPEKIEEEMGDVLEADPFGAAAEGGPGGDKKASLASLRRRVLPPSVDNTLYEL